MGATIFWDVDTQYDFIMPKGKLYIQDAEKILSSLERLTQHAREGGIPIYGSVDTHRPDDPELSADPDFSATFPPHCLEGTAGQEKVFETAPHDPLWIDSSPLPADELAERVRCHTGEVIFQKQQFDVFTNPNVEPVLRSVSPESIVLYGVALDVCNAFAIEGLLERRVAPIRLVVDATQAIDPKRGRQLVASWQSRGVEIVNTQDIVD